MKTGSSSDPMPVCSNNSASSRTLSRPATTAEAAQFLWDHASQQLQREIDRPGGVRQLTDRDKIDAGLGDLANVRRGNTSTGFKFEA